MATKKTVTKTKVTKITQKIKKPPTIPAQRYCIGQDDEDFYLVKVEDQATFNDMRNDANSNGDYTAFNERFGTDLINDGLVALTFENPTITADE